MIKRVAWSVNLILWWLIPQSAQSHVSESGMVLLLPTDLYIAAGIAVVALTVLALAVVPPRMAKSLFRERRLIDQWPNFALGDKLSLVSTLIITVAVVIGLSGSHDPLTNALPLLIWTIWWIVLTIMQGLFGDLWSALNPWTGLYRMLRFESPLISLPEWLGAWPACLLLALFGSFMLADPAPDAPERLAVIVGSYWLFTMMGLILCGPDWLKQCEFYTVLMTLLAQLASIGRSNNGLAIGCPGWRLHQRYGTPVKPASSSIGCLALMFLALGSFDGLNETFTWLAWIGVNPLEFPGRSAIIGETVTGLLATHLALFGVFSLCVVLGLRWIDETVSWGAMANALALTTLPIAFAYHIAHYLVMVLINLQYVAVAMSDPLGNGADLFGLGHHFVSTGFLNSKASVEVIFRIQAGSVVAGHVAAILLAHATALAYFGDHKRAVLSQIPMALFMIAYTFLGLWLLAAPKGA